MHPFLLSRPTVVIFYQFNLCLGYKTSFTFRHDVTAEIKKIIDEAFTDDEFKLLIHRAYEQFVR